MRLNSEMLCGYTIGCSVTLLAMYEFLHMQVVVIAMAIVILIPIGLLVATLSAPLQAKPSCVQAQA